MSTTLIHRRRAVSPVIATVILIAVAVALGIAVAFWASGLTSSFSKYEKLGVNTQYATSVALSSCGSTLTSGTCWTINLGGQNTGSSDSSITQIQVNGIPISTANKGNGFSGNTAAGGTSCSATGTGAVTSFPLAVKSGQQFCIVFNLYSAAGTYGAQGSSTQTFASGQTIQVTIITAAGNNYPASIVLP